MAVAVAVAGDATAAILYATNSAAGTSLLLHPLGSPQVTQLLMGVWLSRLQECEAGVIERAMCSTLSQHRSARGMLRVR